MNIDEGAQNARKNTLREIDSKLAVHEKEFSKISANMVELVKSLVDRFVIQSGAKIENPSRSNCRAFPVWAKKALAADEKKNGVHLLLNTQADIQEVIGQHRRSLQKAIAD